MSRQPVPGKSPPRQHPTRRHPARPPSARSRAAVRVRPDWIVLGLALVVRLLVLATAAGAPFWREPLVDERLHLHLATRLLQGLPPELGAWYVAPGYAYFLAGVMALGGGIVTVKLLQLLLGVLNSWLVYRLGRRWFGPAAGVVAGCLWAVLPSALLYEILLLKPTLTVLCVLVALLLLTADRQVGDPDRDGAAAAAARAGRPGAPSLWRWPLAGLALGAAAILRGEMLVAGAALAAVGLLARARRWPGAPASALAPVLLLAGLAAAVAVPTLQNVRAGGGPVLVAYGGGPNFAIGNSPVADGSYRALRPERMDPFFEEQDAVALAEEAEGRELGPGEVARYWWRRGLSWWGDDPQAAILLTLKKALLVWGWWEGADVISTGAAGRWVWPLRDPLVRAGTVLPVALVGLWLARRRRDLWPLWTFLASAEVTLSLFFIFERFRLPLAAAALPLTGLAVTTGWRRWREGRRGRVVAGVLAAASLIVLLSLPRVAREEEALRTNLATMLMQQGRYEEALQEFEAVERAVPWAGRVHIGLGTTRAALGQRRLATQELAQALMFLYAEGRRTGRLSVEEILYCNELAGDLQASLGEAEAARHHYEMALRLPDLEPDVRERLEGKLAKLGGPAPGAPAGAGADSTGSGGADRRRGEDP